MNRAYQLLKLAGSALNREAYGLARKLFLESRELDTLGVSRLATTQGLEWVENELKQRSSTA